MKASIGRQYGEGLIKTNKQSVILGPLEWTNLFGPSNKVVYLKKLVFESGVRFSILLVLVDAILLSLDLLKRPYAEEKFLF